jgi:hypothetical protein
LYFSGKTLHIPPIDTEGRRQSIRLYPTDWRRTVIPRFKHGSGGTPEGAAAISLCLEKAVNYYGWYCFVLFFFPGVALLAAVMYQFAALLVSGASSAREMERVAVV